MIPEARLAGGSVDREAGRSFETTLNAMWKALLVVGMLPVFAALIARQAARGKAKSEGPRTLQGAPPAKQMAELVLEADEKDPALADYCDLLLDQALMTEGSPVRNPAKFARLVSDLMAK